MCSRIEVYAAQVFDLTGTFFVVDPAKVKNMTKQNAHKECCVILPDS